MTYQNNYRKIGDPNLHWNMYGKGLENIGHDGQPETGKIPAPSDQQMLVRVDSVGMCFSDVKLIRQGRNHPKLYNRDLREEPTRLGHEVSVTVVEVGRDLQDRFSAGQRLAIQPDIYQQGRSTAYGYTIPGGLTQYHLIGAEVLETDAGACVLPLEDGMGYAESALLEPWGCVMAAYTQRRRLEPLDGGTMLIIGNPDDTREYQFSRFLDRPAKIITSDLPASLVKSVQQSGAIIIERNGTIAEQYKALSEEFTNGKGFDDIVMLAPRSAKAVSEIARQIARRGTLNLIGTEPIDGLADADVGRLHYDYIAFVGQQGPEISDSYGEERNRCELKAGGTAVFVGAGGPMGQMHVQRALELPDGPKTLIATDVNQMRLSAITERFGALAEANSRSLILYNPQNNTQTLPELVQEVTGGAGADDVVISVPAASLMEEGGAMLNSEGMLVLFAGVPNGTEAPLDLSPVYLGNTQYTGTSGLTLQDQALVMERACNGTLSPGMSVAAIGGINAAKDGIEAMMDGRYPGKVVIFPQIKDLPLLGLSDIKNHYPEIATMLGANDSWTQAAEEALLNQLGD